MSWPVVINVLDVLGMPAPCRCGPFVNGSDTYIFGRGENLGQYIRVMKSSNVTDPSSWAVVDLANSPHPTDPTGGTVLAADFEQVGNRIFCVFAIGGASGWAYFCRFNMDTDQWEEIDTANVTVKIYQPDSLQTHAGLGVRSDGSIVAVISGDDQKVMGQDQHRVAYSISSDEGATWSAAATLHNVGSEYAIIGPSIVISQADVAHVAMSELDAGTGRITSITISAADVLGSYEQTGIFCASSVSSWGHGLLGRGVVYERGTEEIVRFNYPGPAGSGTPWRVLMFDSSANPIGFDFVEISSSRVLSEGAKAQGVIVVDSTGKMWSFNFIDTPAQADHQFTSDDSDIGDGDNWDTPTQLESSELGASFIGANVFTRGAGSEVIGIVIGHHNQASMRYYEFETDAYAPVSLDETEEPDAGYTIPAIAT